MHKVEQQSMEYQRVAVVTGCASGIGAATVTSLRRDGWSVVGIDLTAQPGKVDDGLAIVRGDASEEHVLAEAVRQAARLGVLEGWVNNAGNAAPTPLDAAAIGAVMWSNLAASLTGTTTAVSRFVELGVRGSIVNVSSIHAVMSAPGMAGYEMAKAAIDALTRSVAVEFGAVGIRANSVAPGAINTPALARAAADADDGYRSFSTAVPLGRVGEPIEVGRMIALLLSPSCSYMTGQRIIVDGGWSASLRIDHVPAASGDEP